MEGVGRGQLVGGVAPRGMAPRGVDVGGNEMVAHSGANSSRVAGRRGRGGGGEL